MKKIPYLIISPPYHPSSAGVRMMHALCHHLNESGYEAYIGVDVVNPEWNEKMCPQERFARLVYEGIIVYPEVVSGNPLGANVVVRYILNHPGLLGGDKVYDSSEILFTCNGETLRQYVPSDDRILCIPLIEDYFKDEGLLRKGGCFYVGKGFNVPRIPETNGMKEIIGMNRREVANILKTSEIFYTYDNFTLLIEEAKKCGCPVVIIGEEISKISYDDYTKDFEKQLDNFIRITQSEAPERLMNAYREKFEEMREEWMRMNNFCECKHSKGEHTKGIGVGDYCLHSQCGCGEFRALL